MFLETYVLTSLEDVRAYFVLPYFYDLTKTQYMSMYGYPHGLYNSLYTYSEPLIIYILFFLSKYFSPFIIYNIFVLTSGILAFYSMYKLLSLFIRSRLIRSLSGLLYVFSPFFIYQSQSHPQLSQVWMPILFLYLFLKEELKDNPLKLSYLKYSLLGLFLGIIILSSNYLGYFLCIFLILYSIIGITRKNILKYIIIAISGALLCSIWLIPFINANYLGSKAQDSNLVLDRPLDDFIYFSSRPWYYLLPSSDNPIFGRLTAAAIGTLQSHWNYFLNLNYFKNEHSSSYIGWINLGFLIYAVWNIKKYPNKKLLYKLLIINMILVVLSMPPYFTHNLKTYWMPSYLLYAVFPMFRVLSRVGYLVNAINLIFIALAYNDFFNYIKTAGKTKKLFLILFAIILVSISFIEMYVPFTITKTGPVPRPMIALNDYLQPQEPVAVYPQSYANYFFFWTRIHHASLINPSGFKNADFDSEEFTSNLNKCESINRLHKMGASNIVVFADDNKVYFDKLNNLDLVYAENNPSGITDYNYGLFKLKDMTSYPSTYLYKIKQEVECK